MKKTKQNQTQSRFNQAFGRGVVLWNDMGVLSAEIFDKSEALLHFHNDLGWDHITIDDIDHGVVRFQQRSDLEYQSGGRYLQNHKDILSNFDKPVWIVYEKNK